MIRTTVRHSVLAAFLSLFAAVCAAQQTAAVTYPPPLVDAVVPSSGGKAVMPGEMAVKEYVVGPNDLLEVEVLDIENGKRTVRVSQSGTITLPLVGMVQVAGLTQQEAELQIAALYGEKYLQDPQVSVFIREFTTERITVDGAVSKPGIYPLVGQMTLLRVIALAGGFGQIANPREVMVYRERPGGQRVMSKFNVDRIRAGKDEDPVILGDDLIVVQRDATRALLKDSVLRDIVDSINPFSVLVPR